MYHPCHVTISDSKINPAVI